MTRPVGTRSATAYYVGPVAEAATVVYATDFTCGVLSSERTEKPHTSNGHFSQAAALPGGLEKSRTILCFPQRKSWAMMPRPVSYQIDNEVYRCRWPMAPLSVSYAVLASEAASAENGLTPSDSS
jgi:hypothetical protein